MAIASEIEVLRVVAGRLTEIVGGDGLVSRLAGDEFGILLRCRKGDDAPVRLARRIVHSVPKPISLASLSIEVGVSVGGTIYDDQHDADGLARRDGSAVETALRQADMAMYRAKTEGRGMYRFFDAAMDARLQERVQLEREIKGAITGYSGLHHLRELSLDTIKIDRSFIMQMLDKPEEAKIVQAILGLGHSLGLQTTAEGIETKEVLDKLISLGCETGQGFLFGRPEPTAIPGAAISRATQPKRQIA